MSLGDYLIILILCSLTMLACRVLPMLLLKGKDLPPLVVRALGFIPPAAFAALVTNDLFDPADFSGDTWAWLAPLIAALIVMIVAAKTKSMAWCIIVGVAGLALLMWIPGVL